MIEIKDIDKLAELSRLGIAAEEKESLRADLDSILEYVKEVQNVASGAELAPDLYLRNVMREDIITTPAGTNTEDLLNCAPKREGQYVQVKKILE